MQTIFTLPKKPGVYVAGKNLKAWKGFKTVPGYHPQVVKVTIPIGAIIVRPSGEESKFRVNALYVPGKKGLYESPIQGADYEKGRLVFVKEIDKNLNENCGHPGLHCCYNREEAGRFARW